MDVLVVSGSSFYSMSSDVCRWPFLARILLCNQSQRDERVLRSRDPSLSSLRLQMSQPVAVPSTLQIYVRGTPVFIGIDFQHLITLSSSLSASQSALTFIKSFLSGLVSRVIFAEEPICACIFTRGRREELNRRPGGCHCLSPQKCNARTLLHVLLGNAFLTKRHTMAPHRWRRGLAIVSASKSA